ncbi:energy transducer TonB [Oleiagrimonas sp.]|uniref:energy transducer TonB n=1 Tax=Oleiagrimonas sp. TaxID=2010330 RepID=UPI00263653DE|nr:energy transducer TonB [Oleiagrimonas sp.]MDA3914146.1 energy transducer TonB [Oleiagrimonas sp.]
MPRLRTTLALCVLALVFSIAATALLSSVQRLGGSVILDPGPMRAEAAQRAPARAQHGVKHAIRSGSKAGLTARARAAEPQPVFSPPPNYPIQALREGRGGLVRIRAQLDVDGHVADAQVIDSSGDPDLDHAALVAARRWQFRMPADAQRSVVLPIRFRIDPQGR